MTLIVKNKTSSTPSLPRSEWNFNNNVPADELAPCLYYEYGRSADHFRKGVAKWRKGHPKVMRAAQRLLHCHASFDTYISDGDSLVALTSSNGITSTERGEALKNWMALTTSNEELPVEDQAVLHPDGICWDNPQVFLYHFPPFPEKAWLELDKFTRAAASIFWQGRSISAVPESNGIVQGMRGLAKPGSKSLSEAQIKRNAFQYMKMFISAAALKEVSDFESVLPGSYFENNKAQLWVEEKYCQERVQFVLNWARSNNEIEAAFKDWLKARRPHKEFAAQKGTSPIEYLTQLGAYRLSKEGIEIKVACQQQPWNGDADKFNRDIRKAKAALKSMF